MHLYSLFAATVFLSSFLLFQVQPLIGKHVLPWYGGSSAVWLTAMFFFMVALAVGYIYALLISKLHPWYQGLLHMLVVVCTLVIMYRHAEAWPSAITPTVGDVSVSFTDPVLAVFTTLLITVGLPFALLASTSSLLQLWYANLSGKQPFSLYSISNIGSLLGLLSYPLFFEPFLTTHTQGIVWSYGIIVYAILLGTVVYLFVTRFVKNKSVENTSVSLTLEAAPTYRRFLLWLAIASVPVMVLLAGTSFMTVSIAPMPFLWVGPLALYLLSFIFTFRSGERPPFWFNEICVVLAAILSLTSVVFSVAHVLVTIMVTHFALFAIFHWCHEYLYALRPSATYLAPFYVALSLGGILGSVVIKISSLYILTMPIELAVILVISTFFVCYKWFFAEGLYFPIMSRNKLHILTLLILSTVVTSCVININYRQKDLVAQERNFFGYKAVVDSTLPGEIQVWSMQHGLTNHGFQVIEDDKKIILPVAYYSETSGIGRAFSYIRSREKGNIKVVIAGLGTGGLAAYCKEGDDFTFLEIDKDVVSLAKEYFTYLDHCPQNEIIMTDARLALENQAEEKLANYNLIVIDAYADDMVPVHLMTSEAISLYKKLLTPEGILAIHISSRYLNLLPVTWALGKDNNMAVRYWYDEAPEAKTAIPSQWVLFANKEEVFSAEFFSVMSKYTDGEKTLLWTDTYSALLPIIRFY